MKMSFQKRSIALVIVVNLCLGVLFLKAAHALVPIEFFPSTYWSSQKPDTSEIEQIIRLQLNLDDDSSCIKAKVKVLYGLNGTLDRLIVHLLDKDYYVFETARIELGADHTVEDFESGYKVQLEDLSQDPQANTHAACLDESVQMVFAGYKEVPLTGEEEETDQAYKKWLSCNDLVLSGRLDIAILLL